MKFTEEKLERAFTELLGQEGFSHYSGITITRKPDDRIVDDEIMLQKVNANIDAYENSMLRNIYSFCKENSFDKAIFMCGVAHRKSIIEKIGEYEKKETIQLNWTFYNDKN